jgi:hypothetical protein
MGLANLSFVRRGREYCNAAIMLFYPRQISQQLLPNLGERLPPSDGEAAWDDRHRRNTEQPQLAEVGRRSG